MPMEGTSSSSATAAAMGFMAADLDFDNNNNINGFLQIVGEVDGNDSRSGSDHNFGNIVDDYDDEDGNHINPFIGEKTGAKKRKKYHRHTPHQSYELENFFKNCQHPDENQRLELGRRLGLESRQVKFWFQNRRTQYKTQMERHENGLLKQEFDRLRLENMTMKDFMTNPLCKTCGGPAIPNDNIIITEEHRLIRMENFRLKDELIRVCGLAEKLLGKPVSDLMRFLHSPPPPTSHQMELSLSPDNNAASAAAGFVEPEFPLENGNSNLMISGRFEKTAYLQVAAAAMDELIAMAQNETSLWYNNHDGKESLNIDEYMKKLLITANYKTPGFVTDARREVSSVNITSFDLVSSMMNSAKWSEMFSCMVRKATTLEMLCAGVNGTHDGQLLLMSAELFFPSPLVPTRRTKFIRFCKQHSQGTWAVVDVSIDNHPSFGDQDFSRRLPSGFIIQDVDNGYSLVTWIEHTEYDDNMIHLLFRPFVRSGLAFGAKRWLAALHRHCELFSFLKSTQHESATGLSLEGRRGLLNLSSRLMTDFFGGICISPVQKWEKLTFGNAQRDIQVLTRVSLNEPGVPSGVIMSVSKSIYIPVSRAQLFDFIRDNRVRGQWDLLSRDSSMQEMVKICKGEDDNDNDGVNRISLLCHPGSGHGGSGGRNDDDDKVVLQETWSDPTNSLVVFTPINMERIRSVIEGGDPNYVELLPSGFVICDESFAGGGNRGSLLTVGFQILVSSCPTAKLNVESIETMSNLVGCTIHKIKTALGCEVTD